MGAFKETFEDIYSGNLESSPEAFLDYLPGLSALLKLADEPIVILDEVATPISPLTLEVLSDSSFPTRSR